MPDPRPPTPVFIRLRGAHWSDLCFYALTALLAVGLKLAWRGCPPTEPRVFLAPLVAVLSFLSGASFTFRPDGYWSPSLGVLITKDCGGMNYFLIALGLLVLSHIRSCRGRAKVAACGGFLIGAYLLTLLANVSRVICVLALGRTAFGGEFLAGRPHLALGALVYFFFLAAGNLLAGALIRKGAAV